MRKLFLICCLVSLSLCGCKSNDESTTETVGVVEDNTEDVGFESNMDRTEDGTTSSISDDDLQSIEEIFSTEEYEHPDWHTPPHEIKIGDLKETVRLEFGGKSLSYLPTQGLYSVDSTVDEEGAYEELMFDTFKSDKNVIVYTDFMASNITSTQYIEEFAVGYEQAYGVKPEIKSYQSNTHTYSYIAGSTTDAEGSIEYYLVASTQIDDKIYVVGIYDMNADVVLDEYSSIFNVTVN